MPWLAGVAAIVSAVAGAGTAIYSSVAQSNAAKKAEKHMETLKPLPGTPKTEDAQNKAKDELDKKRRARLLAGGQTILTSNLGDPYSDVSGDTAPKSLLGS